MNRTPRPPPRAVLCHVCVILPLLSRLHFKSFSAGAEKPRARKLSARVMEDELADELEDQVPDDGTIEIDSDDEFRA